MAQSAIQANLNKKNKKKDKRAVKSPDDQSLHSSNSKLPPTTPPDVEHPTERTPDELADEEWALPEKKIKGKSGQSKQQGTSITVIWLFTFPISPLNADGINISCAYYAG